MDRQFWYPGQQMPVSSLLKQAKANLFGLGFLAKALLGNQGQSFTTQATGLLCAPTSPPTMSVTVGEGAIFAESVADANPYGALGTDSTVVVKQGLNLATQTFALAAPAAAGQSIVYLIEAQYSEVDSGAALLSYVNAANPTGPALQGQGGNGISQPTVRQGVCAMQVKAGTPAATGSQVAPAADVGYVPLWLVTVANGQTTITSANIAMASTAPFIEPITATSFQIATGITKTIGGAGADFADLNAAFTWLSAYTITNSGYVTFQLAAGQFVYNTNTNINHTNSDRILVNGAPMSGAAVQHTDITVTGYSALQRSNDAASNLAMFRSRFATELRFSGAGAAVWIRGVSLRNILFTSDGSTQNHLIISDGGPGGSKITTIDGCAVHGAQFIGIVAQSGGQIYFANNPTFSCANGWQGFVASGNSHMSFGTTVGAYGNGVDGFIVDDGGTMSSYQPTFGGTPLVVYASGNNTNGFAALALGGIDCHYASAVNNGGCGFSAYFSACVSVDYSTASGNAFAGFNVWNCGSMSALNTLGSGNGINGYAAFGASNIYATGGGCTGAAAQAAPAFNTLSSSGSYIQY
jgi:hypothetical protein